MPDLRDRLDLLARPDLLVSRVARPGRPELLVIQPRPLVLRDPPETLGQQVAPVLLALLALLVPLALLVLLVLPE
jgi:hypothetical protein